MVSSGSVWVLHIFTLYKPSKNLFLNLQNPKNFSKPLLSHGISWKSVSHGYQTLPKSHRSSTKTIAAQALAAGMPPNLLVAKTRGDDARGQREEPNAWGVGWMVSWEIS